MNSGLPKTCRSFTAESSLANNSLSHFSELVTGYFTESKNTHSSSRHRFFFLFLWPITIKDNSLLCTCMLCLLFFCMAFAFFLRLTCYKSIQHLHGGLKSIMFPIPFTCPEQTSWSLASLSLKQLQRTEEKHLSPLSCGLIRCPYLFRVEEINLEWSIVGHGECGREEEREGCWKEGNARGAAWLIIAHVFVWADGIY